MVGVVSTGTIGIWEGGSERWEGCMVCVGSGGARSWEYEEISYRLGFKSGGSCFYLNNMLYPV